MQLETKQIESKIKDAKLKKSDFIPDSAKRREGKQVRCLFRNQEARSQNRYQRGQPKRRQ